MVDSDGRSVDLTEERWGHVINGHPEMARHLDEILETVRDPARSVPGRAEGEMWYYGEGVGPSRWLKVVVRYEATGRGLIVTAFGRRSMP